ncbi:MAG: heavy metal translocating P-type ATPase [Rhodospirillales bacterium]|nr:heavy metal translocating P-type ATPase [Rhodospirillales bacterium]
MPALPLRRTLLFVVLLALAAGFAVGPLPWIAAALLVGALVAVDLVRAALRGRFGVDVIALLAVLGAVSVGEYLAGAIIALMVASGTALEEFAAARARRELGALIGRTPRVAHRTTPAGLEDVPIASVTAGQVLLVKSGEIVPVDGIAQDAALLDESALTGEPVPVERVEGSAVSSGVVNAGGPFRLCATASAADSTQEAVIRLVRQAEESRAPMVRLADRWALVFLAATLGLAALAWTLADAERAVAVLVVATPCPLILAAPIALVCGLSRSARRGVIVKDAGVLERLARIRTVLFDKTGTLTSGTPRVTGVETLDGYDPDAVLRLAAALAETSQHVVSQAIVAAARASDVGPPAASAVEEIAGGGLAGVVEGRRVMLGSAGMLRAAGLPPPSEGAIARLATAAASVAWVAVDDRVAGALLLSDRVRPDAARALRGLRSAGIRRLVMVSGDRAASAESVGTALGLDAVHAELSPAGKIACIAAERAAGPTVMVGDGINDAPALAAADVGIAMGARGAAAAAEAADVVLLVDRLDRIPEAIGIARRARTLALQSILLGMGLSLAAMLAAAAGALPVIAGALLQEAIDAAAILNALRVLSAGHAPAPLGDRAAVGRVVTEHAELRRLLERMRRLADRMEPHASRPAEDLRQLQRELSRILLPHQAAEERAVFPDLAQRLGGRDPLGAMNRMHAEIADLAGRFDALVAGLGPDGASHGEVREARRLLHALDAVIGLHLVAEEELLAEVEDLPQR